MKSLLSSQPPAKAPTSEGSLHWTGPFGGQGRSQPFFGKAVEAGISLLCQPGALRPGEEAEWNFQRSRGSTRRPEEGQGWGTEDGIESLGWSLEETVGSQIHQGRPLTHLQETHYLVREVFYKYLSSDYDRPSGLYLGSKLGNGTGKAPDLPVRASRREH